MSTIVSILRETEVILPPADDKQALMEALRQARRQEALSREFVPGGRRDPHAVPNRPGCQ
jgi:hypothetical protein